jgi:hypothetical protein
MAFRLRGAQLKRDELAREFRETYPEVAAKLVISVRRAQRT